MNLGGRKGWLMNSAATTTYPGLLLKLGREQNGMDMQEALHLGESPFYVKA